MVAFFGVYFVVLSLAITFLTSLLAALITVNGTSHDRGPLGDGKATYDTKMPK